MHQYQFMNFDIDANLDRPIYRIMPQQHAISLFQDRQNVMSKLVNWKDKFENFLMNCGHEVDGVKHDNTTKEQMVAQCWTQERFSEAMWGIYASDPTERFLRIRSTPRKLLSALVQAAPYNAQALCRIGRVEYKSISQIKSYYEDKKSSEVNMTLLFQSLLLKRKTFRHEREVRLMHCAMFGNLDDKGLFRHNIDPHTMITQIMADPNRGRLKWSKEKKQIRLTTGFCGEIKRSKIYDAPDW